MVSGPARPLVCACLLLGPIAGAVADDPPVAARRPTPVDAGRAKPSAATPPATLDPVQVRAESEGRIKGLPPSEKDQTEAQKALREIWTERLTLIDDWEKAVKARKDVENPQPAPGKEAARLTDELVERKAMLEQLTKSPETILSDLFRAPADQVDDAKLGEMSKSIEDVRNHLNDRSTELEKLKAKADPAARATRMRELGIDRDRLHARKSTLPTLRATLEAAYKSATTDEAKRVARERLMNLPWEAALAEGRLATAEANVALEKQRGELNELAVKDQEVFVVLTQASLTAMSRRYALVAENKKAALRAEASREREKASKSDDPIEKFRARRMAEILGLEAQVIEYDKVFSASPPLSTEEQKAAADHAERDFAELKAVVSENRVGGLVALKLNNDFRRLSRERAMIQRNELADAVAAHAHYENALTEAELSYINDDRDDRFERDAFIETLPPARRAEGDRAIEAIEKQHRQLLLRRKVVLEKLLDRAESIHAQVERRLRILDAQYAFIRTRLFWVRDTEPISETTLSQARRDGARLASAITKLGAEPLDRSAWSPVSVEFGLMVAVLALTAPVIVFARGRLKAMIAAPRAAGPVIHII